MSREDLDRVYEYHDGTKHHFHRFAQAMGYLDWASQPRPFRSFEGSPTVGLYPRPDAPGARIAWPRPTYDQLFDGRGPAGGEAVAAAGVTAATLGYVLRYALGLSAWKVMPNSRWSLRVNPSSGNLHPTEAYFVTGALNGLGDTPGVWHYAPDRHVAERRSTFAPETWGLLGLGEPGEAFLVALSSIHWRESWKYGERAFRYCQHDLGHAVAALSLSAALCGWRVAMLPAWSQRAVATLAGLDRDEDYFEAEREDAACVLLVTSGPSLRHLDAVDGFVDAVRRGRWFGHASQLSEEHIAWRFIDEVAHATESPGGAGPGQGAAPVAASLPDRGLAAETLLLQRRSAVAFDGMSVMTRAQFVRMLARVMPGATAPWDALWWSPRIHLAVFVHRVEGLASGLYLLPRDGLALPRLKAALSASFVWEPVIDSLPLWLLQAGDYRMRARRVSCDQDIAGDGFFSLGMLADFDASLAEHGPSFYRNLFWESGIVGQVLYLEAEAAGARATGIGCFYDDPVHDLLGVEGHAFQSLYHFTVGMGIEDGRLTTEPGYAWETTAANQTAVDS